MIFKDACIKFDSEGKELMHLIKPNKKNPALPLIWFLEGIIVGFGAILPGISGGTLCVAFGMYRPVIEIVSDLKSGLKKHGFMLGVFLTGVAAGFVGLSGLAAMLMERNTVLVTCAFIGFIIGTIPELWQDAGTEGRNRGCYVALFTAFAVMLVLLILLKTKLSVTVAPGIAGFLLCGVLWGFSFIIPGLSSSSLLLFFGLYQPMLQGISHFEMPVLIPMGLGMAACVLLLAKVIGFLYKRFYSAVSHSVLGIVAATAVMIMPIEKGSLGDVALKICIIAAGAVAAYQFTRICNKLQSKAVTEP